MNRHWRAAKALAGTAWTGLQLAFLIPFASLLRWLVKRKIIAAAEPRGFHHHKCSACDMVWSHDDRRLKSVSDFREAHTCPNCGKDKQKRVYYPHDEKLRSSIDALITRP